MSCKCQDLHIDVSTTWENCLFISMINTKITKKKVDSLWVAATPMTRFLYIRILFRGIGARGEELRRSFVRHFSKWRNCFFPHPLSQPFCPSFKKRLNFYHGSKNKSIVQLTKGMFWNQNELFCSSVFKTNPPTQLTVFSVTAILRHCQHV